MAEEMASPEGSVSESDLKQDDEFWTNEEQKREKTSENSGGEPILEKFPSQENNEDEENTPIDPTLKRSESMDDQDCDDSDDDDDDVIVTINNIALPGPNFPKHPLKRIDTQPTNQVMMKQPTQRGIDVDAPGMIGNQSTIDFDINNAFKDEEKPWKKPGADINDYFNYGFTEETWNQYSERQRRLRAENNIARLNTNSIVPVAPIMPGHPQMIHPMVPHPIMMGNKHPPNMQILTRPFPPQRKMNDGKIDVIGATDQTTRRPNFDGGNGFEHMGYMNAPGFPPGQQANGQTVGDLVTSQPTPNGPPPGHGTPPGANHQIPTLGGHRLPLMPPPGAPMQFRPPFVHAHLPGGPPFYPHPPGAGMHGERPQQPYFIAHHPHQPWEKPGGVPPVHNIPGPFPGQPTVGANLGNGRAGQGRSPTPEDGSHRSSTPEESRPSGGNADADKNSKDSRYKDRYKDDVDHHSSSRRRTPPKEHSSSGFRPRRRSGDHEYERPRTDRKSSRDRDDKYERYSRKRHHRDEGSRHHRTGDDDSSRSHRSTRRSPSKNFSSPPKSSSSTNNQPVNSEISQIGSNENVESTENEPSAGSTNISSSPNNRSRREDSERSSSRHGHHKKSSKRSRRDSGEERSGHHHRRRSKEKSTSSKKSSNSAETSADFKEQNNE